MKFETPQFLTDLYADLRDRRLLPLLVVLVAAMVVVPMALSKSAKPSSPLPAPSGAVTTGNSSPLLNQPVVLSNPGVRDYRRRLRGYAPVDPFLPRVQGVSNAGTSSSASATGGLTPTGNSGSSSSSNVGLTAEGKKAAAAANGTSVPSSAPTGGSTTQPVQTQSKFYYYRVKVRAGVAGNKLKVHDSVGTLTALPTKDVPVAEFLGVTTDSSFQPNQAVFLVNSAVSSVSGTGSCTFAGTYCQVVSLKPGQHEDFVWTNGIAYRIEMVNFDLVVRNTPPSVAGQGSSGGGTGRKSRSNSLASRHFSF